MGKLHIKMGDIANIAAILVTISSLLASVSWISSSKAGGQADDQKTAALGFMILRLESSTEASTGLVQAQSYLTQAGMYFAEADSSNDESLKSYLESLGFDSLNMSHFYSAVAEESEIRAESYYDNYTKTLNLSNTFSKKADNRSTGALIFNVSAIVASACVLFKRKEFLYVYIPIFMIGLYYTLVSLI
jgi:hypothetical protein